CCKLGRLFSAMPPPGAVVPLLEELGHAPGAEVDGNELVATASQARPRPMLITYQSPRQKRARLALRSAPLALSSPGAGDCSSGGLEATSPPSLSSRSPSGLPQGDSPKASSLEAGGPELLSSFRVLDVLGKTHTCSVHLAVCPSSCKQVALKVINKTAFLSRRPRTRCLRHEAELLAKLQHPRVVELHRWFESEDELCLVMEYVPGGDLLRSILDYGHFSEPQARRLFLQLADAVSYLHSQNVVHRDLKPENILLTEAARDSANVKVTDFGISRVAHRSRECQTFCGSQDYTAPEVLRMKLGSNTKLK
ncbi:unnamed protein product, partial [Polarella glacialis]